MRGARPPSRHCPESGRACALRCRHRRAWGPRAGRAGLGRCAALRRGHRGAEGGRAPRLFVPRPARLQAAPGQRSAAQLARGPGPAWRAGPRLLTLFLGDFGSRSPPRSDRRRLVMSPRPALEQSQGCWQAAALRRELGEARACCARRGR